MTTNPLTAADHDKAMVVAAVSSARLSGTLPSSGMRLGKLLLGIASHYLRAVLGESQ